MPNLSISMPFYGNNGYFPTPHGNVYMINSSAELGNIPTGPNLSAALCLPEGILHLKTIQNGSPMILSYKLSSLDAAATQPPAPIPTPMPTQSQPQAPSPTMAQSAQPTSTDKFLERLHSYEERLAAVESRLLKTEQTPTLTQKPKKEVDVDCQF